MSDKSRPVKLTDEAHSNLFELPERAAQVVSFNLFKLAEATSELGQPADAPFPLGQEFPFQYTECLGEGGTWWFRVIFQFGQDEETIHVLTILGQRVTE